MPSDGDLIQAVGRPEIYVIEGGKRRLIPDMETFYDWDFAPGAVRAMREADLNAIPLGDPLPPSKRFEINQRDNLGANHWMETNLYVSSRTGKLRAITRTWTGTWLGGFHGGVQLLFLNANGAPAGSPAATQMHIFGVDGTIIGRSDRRDPWEEDISMDTIQRTEKVMLIHTWAPNDIRQQIDRIIGLTDPIIDKVKEIMSLIGGSNSTDPAPAKKTQAITSPPCMAGQPEFSRPTPIPETGGITGTVSSSTGEAIGNATVSVLGTSISTRTGSTGNYKLSNVPSGMQQVRASATGYNLQTKSAKVNARETIPVNFKLIDRECPGPRPGRVVCVGGRPRDL